MNEKLANPKVLGYASLFITGWMISMINAGWFMGDPKVSIVLGLILGGVVVALAGIFAYFKGQTFEMTLFLIFGALFFVYSLTGLITSSMSSQQMAYNGWLDILWAVFFFYMWITHMKKGVFVNLFLIGVWLTFLALGIGGWTGVMFISAIGGYIGLATALLAGWLSLSESMKDMKEAPAVEA